MTNAVSTPPQREYISPDIAITSAGWVVLAHGLGYTPKVVNVSLICQSDDAGYPAGNEAAWIITDYTNHLGLSIVKNSTNLTIRFGAHYDAFGITHKTTGNSTVINHLNWKIKLRAA